MKTQEEFLKETHFSERIKEIITLGEEFHSHDWQSEEIYKDIFAVKKEEEIKKDPFYVLHLKGNEDE